MKTYYKIFILSWIFLLSFSYLNGQDLNISKSLSSAQPIGSPIPTNESFSYIINYSINNTALTNISIQDVVPADLQILNVGANPANWNTTINTTTNTITLDFIGTLTNSLSGSFPIQVKFKKGVVCDGTIACNTISIIGYENEVKNAVNSNRVCVEAEAQDRWDFKKTFDAGGALGSDAIFDLTILDPNNNHIGGYHITNAEIKDVIPTGATVSKVLNYNGVDITNTNLVTIAGNIVTITVGNLSTVNWYRQYRYQIYLNFPAGSFSNNQTLTNTATLTYDLPCTGAGSSNSITDDAQVTLTTPNISGRLNKWVNEYNPYYDDFVPGCKGRYSIRFENDGNVILNNLDLFDNLPTNLPIVIDRITVSKPSGTNNVPLEYLVAGTPTSLTPSPTSSSLDIYTNPSISANADQLKFNIDQLGIGQVLYVNIEFEILALYANNTPVNMGDIITNCAEVSIPSSALETSCDDFIIEDYQPGIKISKSFGGGNYSIPKANPGSTVRYRLRVQNHGSAPANNMTLTDVLDNRLEYLGGETYYFGGSSSPNAASFTATAPAQIGTLTTNHTGLNNLEWQVQNMAGDCSNFQYFFIEFDVKVKNTASTANGNHICNRFMASGTGFTTQNSNNICFSTHDFSDTYPQKKVKNANSVSFSTAILSQAGNAIEYELDITNSGNVTFKDIVLVDMLPFVGDTKILDNTNPRNSQFPIQLTAPITSPSGFTGTIYYSTVQNPDFNADINNAGPGTTAPNWQNQVAIGTNWTSVKNVKIEYPSTFTLAPGASEKFIFQGVVPVGAPTGFEAFNSFAYLVTTVNGNNVLFPGESNCPSIKIAETNSCCIGDRVWMDTNFNGLQDTGEPGINNVTINLVDAGNGNILATTVSADNYLGQPGFYQFCNLEDATYKIEVVLGTGQYISYQDAGNDDTVDSDIDPNTNQSADFTIVTQGGDCSINHLDIGISDQEIKVCPDNNHALNFDGVDDYVSLTNPLTGNPDFTFEAWIYPTATNNDFHRYLGMGGNNTRFELGERNGVLTLFYHPTSTEVSGSAVSRNTWHHVAVTKEGNTVRVYLNCQEDIVDTAVPTFDFTASMRLGRWAGSTVTGLYKGNMDEVRFWRRAKTLPEIEKFKNCELSGAEEDLMFYYDFNQGVPCANNTGVTSLLDGTANQNHGTLNHFSLGTGAGSTEISNWVCPGFPKVKDCVDNAVAAGVLVGGVGTSVESSPFGPITVDLMCPENIILDGAASTNEDGYYLSIVELDFSTWTVVNTLFPGQWICAGDPVACQVPNNIDITAYAGGAGAFMSGKTYQVTLAVGSPWDAIHLHFKIDDIPPVITNCPTTPITVQAPAGDAGMPVNLPTLTATDNCLFKLTCDYESGDFFLCGSTDVTCIAVDSSGNKATCVYQVIVDCPCMDCEQSELLNGGFANGAGNGAIPTNWSSATGSPQTITNDACQDNISMQMWGNRDTGEAIKQEGLSFKAGVTYTVSFCGRFVPQNLPTSYVQFGFTASNQAVNPFTYSNHYNVGMTQVGQVSSSEWACYTLPDWTPDQDYSILTINTFNANADNNDATNVSWGRIDNICIKEKNPDPCPNTLVQDGAFDNGLTNWAVTLGSSPQFTATDGCAMPGSVHMWGNQVVGEGIQQSVSFVQGQSYQVSFCGKWLDLVQDSVQIRFRASNGPLSNYANCNAPNCEDIWLSPVLDLNWNTYTSVCWTPAANYNNLSITLWNPYSVNNGSYVSWARIDDICVIQKETPCEIEVNFNEDIVLCPDVPIQLNPIISGAVGAVTCSWSPSINLNNPTSCTPTFTATNPGTYNYTVTVIDANDCVATATIPIVVREDCESCCLSPETFADQVNQGFEWSAECGKLTTTIPDWIDPACDHITWTWGDGTITSPNGQFSGTVMHDYPTTGGTYVVCMTVVRYKKGTDIICNKARYCIKIRLPDCACPCDETFYEAVGAGFARKSSCRTMRFGPLGNLGEHDAVSWNISQGNTLIHTATTSTPTYTFPSNGTYKVCMYVIRTNPTTGEKCKSVYCEMVRVFCLPDVGDVSQDEVVNASLDIGVIDGGLNSGGAVEGWSAPQGDPVVIDDPISCAGRAYVQLEGNRERGDILEQVLEGGVLAGVYELTLCYRYLQSLWGEIPEDTEMVVRLASRSQNERVCAGTCTEVARIKVPGETEEWVSAQASIVLEDNIAGAAYLAIHLENGEPDDGTEASLSKILLDNIHLIPNEACHDINLQIMNEEDYELAGVQVYRAAVSLVSDALVANGAQVSYLAQNNIRLTPGFTVEKGGAFIAKIEDCDDSGFSLTSEESTTERTTLQKEQSTLMPSSVIELTSYPNPFQHATTVQWTLPTDGQVAINVFDMNGKQQLHIPIGQKVAGVYQLELPASQLGTGIFYLQLQTETSKVVHKLVVLK